VALATDHPSGLQKSRLVEIRPVQIGEVHLLGWEIVNTEDRALSADVGTVSAINTFVGIDEHLRNGSRRGICGSGGDCGSGALCDADKVFGAGVSDYISHGFCSSGLL
jgi:hypothetical protein